MWAIVDGSVFAWGESVPPTRWAWVIFWFFGFYKNLISKKKFQKNIQKNFKKNPKKKFPKKIKKKFPKIFFNDPHGPLKSLRTDDKFTDLDEKIEKAVDEPVLFNFSINADGTINSRHIPKLENMDRKYATEQENHGLEFYPGKRNLGRQLYKVGLHWCYIDRDVLFRSIDNKMISLNELSQLATP